VALLGAAFGTALTAQEAEVTELDAITVTGTGLPTEVLKSPSSVTVVDQEQIKRVPPSSVAQLLRDVPGVSVTESGIERLRIRGESSQRVAILIDGERISDHTNYGTPILISPTEIERIEVVRGPSSVVSGNRAIGGVVNIITKRGADKPVEVTASAGYLGPNDGYRASASIAGTVENFDYRLSFSKSDLNDRETANGPLVPSGSEDRDIHAFAGYRLSNHYFGVRVQDYDLSADVYTGSPTFSIDLPKRDLRKYSAFYEGENLTPWMSLLTVNAYSQTVDREFRNKLSFPIGPMRMNVNSTSDDKQDTSGLIIRGNMEFAPGHRTVVGLEFEDDQLVSDKVTTRGTTPSFCRPPSVSTRYSDASIRTWSAFGQHEITTGALTSTLGVRYYNVKSSLDEYRLDGVAQAGRENSDDRFLGSLGFVYELSEDAIVRANISQGYTYPSLSQLFLTSTGGGGTVIGNPDLKPETATNFELGARIDRGAVVLDAALFYTEAKDYVAAVGTGIPRQSRYENVNRADSWGLEVAAEFDPGWSGFRPYLSVSNVTREFQYSNGFTTRDSGTPEWSGVAGVRKDWTAGRMAGSLDLFLRSESGTTQRNNLGQVVDETSGWTTLNLRGNVDLTETVDLNFEVGNITDKFYRPVDQIEGAGRYVSLFLTAKF
jgi:hemoglobin/transferrin/lactoferrin receptor protein